jgi:hypothetical protein
VVKKSRKSKKDGQYKNPKKKNKMVLKEKLPQFIAIKHTYAGQKLD